ncbi:MAG: F0F1 ATP synthase subunit B [Actinobacteria bacterium]|nr:F0F1 ATP synthase subunit B [Actinomycetota bacterium]
MEEVLKIINPMTSTVFWSVISFVILLAVVLKFVAKPVNRILEKRQQEIRESLDSAERKNDAASKLIQEKEMLLDAAREEAQRIIHDGKTEAKKIREEIEEKASEKSRTIMQAAMQEIDNEKIRSLEEVRDRIVDIALDASEKIISRKLSEQDHKRLIEESLNEIEKI